MELRVLGALEVRHDGSFVELRAPMHRRLLVLLATRPNQPVSSQTLVDELWEGDAPRTAGSAFRTYLSVVRQVLDRGECEAELGRLPLTPNGYVLRVASHELDAWRFEDLVDAASSANQLGDPAGAESRLVQALALWRGPALADARDLGAVTIEVARLTGLRRRALEELAEARLALGRNGALPEMLRDAIEEFPLHETFAEQLMLARYRSGHQVEALRAFGELQQRLAEIGLEPSDRLRALADDVLLRNPHLEPARVAEQPRAVMARMQHTRPIGRREELRRMLDAHARAAQGERGLILLSGPAGIGKTTLAAEFAERARLLGASVLEAACRVDDGGGYEALGEMIGAMSTELGDSESELVRLCKRARPDDAEAGELALEREQLRLFEAMAAAIRDLGEQPVVLLVEDLHWAGSATLLALRHLLRFAEINNLLVVATVRSDDLDAEHEREIARLAPAARTQRLALAGFDEHETRSLVRALAGAGCPIIDVSSNIRDATDGNPFFIDVLLRDLGAHPVADRAELEARIAGAAPAGVRALIDRTVERMSQEARAVLEAGAVLGGELSPELLARVSRQPLPRVTELIDDLLGARLLVEIAAFVDRFTFPHALVRNAVYLGIGDERCLALHRSAAEAIEAMPSDGPARAVQIAHHICLATTAPTDCDAAIWAERAGAEAAHGFAFAEAADWYDRAVRLGGIAGPPGGGATFLALGLACDGARQWARARRAYLAAADRAREQRDATLFADVAIAAAPAWTSGMESPAEVEQMLADALDALGTDDPSRRILLLAKLATLAHYSDHERQRRLVDEACALAQGDGVDAHALAVTAQSRHLWLTHDPPACKQRLDLSRNALAISRGESGTSTQLVIQREVLADLLENGDIDAFDAALDAYEAAAAAGASPRDMHWAMALRATQATLRGDLPMAEQLARGAMLRGREVSLEAPGAEFLQSFVIRYQQGRLSEIVGGLRGTVDEQPAYRAGAALAALACVETGFVEEGTRRARWALGPTGDMIQKDVLWLGAHALMCGVAASAHDAGLAEMLYETLEPCSDQIAVFGAGGAVLGSVHYWRGLVAATALPSEQAEEHLVEAVRVAERLRAPFWVAQAQFDLARLLARPGRADRADEVDELDRLAIGAAEQYGFGRLLHLADRV